MPGAENPLAIGSDDWPGLAKLAEEAGELQQVVGKIMAFPYLPPGALHPDGTDLKARLEEEIGDVMGILSYIAGHPLNNLDLERVDARSQQKFERFMRWDREERARREAAS